jgi:hypothetical protein
MNITQLPSQKESICKNDIAHNKTSYTINQMKNLCKKDAPGLELDMRLIEREVVGELNMHNEEISEETDNNVNIRTPIPHDITLNELAETAPQRLNSKYGKVN